MIKENFTHLHVAIYMITGVHVRALHIIIGLLFSEGQSEENKYVFFKTNLPHYHTLGYAR